MKRNYYQHMARMAAERNDIAPTMQPAYIAGYEKGFEAAIRSLKELQVRYNDAKRDIDMWIDVWTNVLTDDTEWE